MKPEKVGKINEIIVNFHGKATELQAERGAWISFEAQIGVIFDYKDLGNTVGKLNSFFLRGREPEFD
jgi:hypothetical protein